MKMYLMHAQVDPWSGSVLDPRTLTLEEVTVLAQHEHGDAPLSIEVRLADGSTTEYEGKFLFTAEQLAALKWPTPAPQTEEVVGWISPKGHFRHTP